MAVSTDDAKGANLKVILTLVLMMWLAACSLLPTSFSQPAQLQLLSPMDGPSARLLKQKITLETQPQQQWLVILRLQHDLVQWLALSPTGQPLLSLQYDGHTLVEDNYLSIDINSVDILATMQFVFWPVSSITQHYSASDGWDVRISADRRVLQHAGNTLLEVTFLAKGIIINNHIHHYRLNIATLEQ
ncbi:MAG: hypothetical protein COB23_04890 [Methylophaga sp.]|nr:MAG: hypothetical protein COB23_04890 [Methylophaga sp.]